MANIVLIGAGSHQFGYGTLGDIFCTPSLQGSTITLLDINAKKLKEVHDHTLAFLEQDTSLQFTIKATTNREEALQGADFVIISIEIGDRFVLWDQDRTIAQQYGIRQIYGENGGPGGLFHSLRIVPPILAMCEDIQRICPDAFVFNYSNPMSRICTTVHKKFPDIKFIGLCHEIASLERYLPSMLHTSFDNLELVAGGLNHFSVLLEAHYKDSKKDVYPDIRAKAKEFFKTVPTYSDYMMHLMEHGEFIETEGATEMADISASRFWGERRLFLFILEQFGLLPITSDSHFGEYLGWAYDVADHRGILDFYRYYQRYMLQKKHKIEKRISERIAIIIDGIIQDVDYIEAAVNIPNSDGNGGKYISELPECIAVEVPARINKNGVQGIALPPLPPAYAGILRNQVGIHDMTAHAIMSKSKQSVVQALLVDPVVDVARNISEYVEVMVEVQKEYLEYLQ